MKKYRSKIICASQQKATSNRTKTAKSVENFVNLSQTGNISHTQILQRRVEKRKNHFHASRDMDICLKNT